MIHYSGNDCENETDACQETPCSLNRTCIDLSPKDEILLGRGYNCSACPLGYDEIDSSCTGRFLTILAYKLNFFAICYKIRFNRTDRIILHERILILCPWQLYLKFYSETVVMAEILLIRRKTLSSQLFRENGTKVAFHIILSF